MLVKRTFAVGGRRTSKSDTLSVRSPYGTLNAKRSHVAEPQKQAGRPVSGTCCSEPGTTAMVLKKFAPDMTGDIGARFATFPEVVFP